ncbi:MAG: SAM-dependent methyltransferase [Deltaproteobacteria bacterium]|nr:SAM-dependent methyltransferase [Deltaproteobacteria bacterium]
MEAIGTVRHAHPRVPRHWSVSDLVGELLIDEPYRPGLTDIRPGDRIAVVFLFHKSPPFNPSLLHQNPPHRDRALGVFSTCSPLRPNPIGLSVLEVLEVRAEEGVLSVRGIDMLDTTPILDIKPYVSSEGDCPSRENR